MKPLGESQLATLPHPLCCKLDGVWPKNFWLAIKATLHWVYDLPAAHSLQVQFERLLPIRKY